MLKIFFVVLHMFNSKPIIMKLQTRCTRDFMEIKVDEVETTIWSSSESEIKETINNLLEVVSELSSYTDKTIQEHLEEFFQS